MRDRHTEKRELYEFKFLCENRDLGDTIYVLETLDTIGWYNMTDVVLLQRNGGMEEGAEFFGICLPIGIADLLEIIGKKISYHPLELEK